MSAFAMSILRYQPGFYGLRFSLSASIQIEAEICPPFSRVVGFLSRLYI